MEGNKNKHKILMLISTKMCWIQLIYYAKWILQDHLHYIPILIAIDTDTF